MGSLHDLIFEHDFSAGNTTGSKVICLYVYDILTCELSHLFTLRCSVMFAYEPNIKRKRHVGCSWMRALVMKMESHRICISWRKLCLQMAGAHINSTGLTQNGIALTVQKNKSHSCISVCWRPWGHLCQGLVSTVTRRAHRGIRYSKKKKRTSDLQACFYDLPLI